MSFLVAYYVAFGPHGPRTPSTPAGETTRLVVGIVSSILIATGMYYAVRASGALFVGINVSHISLMIQSSPSPFLPFCITTLSFNSSPSTKDHVKGVARGHERKGKGTEDEPHPRCVYYEISKSISSRLTITFPRSLPSLQVLHRRATLARVSFSKRRNLFLSLLHPPPPFLRSLLLPVIP